MRKQKLNEVKSLRKIGLLIEGELEQAEVIIASKSILDKFQKMAENLAKMQADVMPLVDRIKEVFDSSKADHFEKTVTDAIQQSLSSIREHKDSISNALLVLEGKESIDDLDSSDNDDNLNYSDLEKNDDFSGDNASSGPENEPLGRSRRTNESLSEKYIGFDKLKQKLKRQGANNPAAIAASIGMKKYGKNKFEKYAHEGKKLHEESLSNLVKWVLKEAQSSLSPKEYSTFATKVAKTSADNPIKLRDWIENKKYGSHAMAQLTDPLSTNKNTRISEEKSYKNYKYDDEIQNIKSKRKMNSEKRNIGKQKRKIDEDSMNTQDKQNLTTAISQLSSKITSNPGLKTGSAQNAINQLDSNSRQAMTNAMNKAKQAGKNINNASDLLTNSSEMLDENNNSIIQKVKNTPFEITGKFNNGERFKKRFRTYESYKQWNKLNKGKFALSEAKTINTKPIL